MKPTTRKKHSSEKLSLYLSRKLSILTICLTDHDDIAYGHNFKTGSTNVFQNREINMETFKKSILMLRDNSGERDILSIGFYSKDPLLELGLIKKIVDYCNEQLVNNKIDYVIDTNLGLLTDEVLEFLERENFQLLTDLGVSSIESLLCLDNDVVKNIFKIKREYRGLFNNINIVSNLNKENKSDDNCSDFLNKIKRMYSEDYKKLSSLYTRRDLNFLNRHKKNKSMTNIISIIDPSIWEMQGIANTEGYGEI